MELRKLEAKIISLIKMNEEDLAQYKSEGNDKMVYYHKGIIQGLRRTLEEIQ